MIIVFTDNKSEGVTLTLPRETLMDYGKALASVLSIGDNEDAGEKQRKRAIRMFAKSTLISFGDGLRSGIGITEKPGKKDDIIQWHCDAVVNRFIDELEKYRWMILIDETATVLEICPVPICPQD